MGRLHFLYRNSTMLDFSCQKMLCNALMQPHLDYCSSSWHSSLTAQLRSRLDIVQRKMARFVYALDNRAHIGNKELCFLSWLNFPDCVNYFKLVHLFKIRLGSAPQYLLSDFTLLSNSHGYHTRGSKANFHVSKLLSTAPSSFAFTSVKQWNNLPDWIKAVSSLTTFKKRLKEHFFSQY